MKYLKKFNESVENIESICEKYGIENYTINFDGSIDVDGNVDLYDKKLTELPLLFNRVTGDFICATNQLTSLKGCPRYVGGVFSCSFNELTTLEGGPSKVVIQYNANRNELISLKGAPTEVSDFRCSANKLVSLEGCPSKGWILDCDNNNITSLRGLPTNFDFVHFRSISNPIHKYWSQVSSSDNFDNLEIFLYMDVDTEDGDEVCQQKVDYILNN
jgi:hypothetical protein